MMILLLPAMNFDMKYNVYVSALFIKTYMRQRGLNVFTRSPLHLLFSNLKLEFQSAGTILVVTLSRQWTSFAKYEDHVYTELHV